MPREELSADREYFVSPAGDDAASGLSAGEPLKTLQAAVNKALRLDTYGYNIDIQLAAGTYHGIRVPWALVGGGTMSIMGDTEEPGAHVIRTENGDDCIFALNDAHVTIGWLRLEAVGTPVGIGKSVGLRCNAQAFGGIVAPVEFGECRTHMSTGGGSLGLSANYKITGGAFVHLLASTTSFVGGPGNRVVTIENNPHFSTAFIKATRGGNIDWRNPTEFIGTATGRRYLIEVPGCIHTFGQGEDHFPGDVPGIITGDWYS